MTKDKFFTMTKTLNNHHLAIRMLIKTFTEYTKVWILLYKQHRIWRLSSALDALCNARLGYSIKDPLILKNYRRAITDDYKNHHQITRFSYKCIATILQLLCIIL